MKIEIIKYLFLLSFLFILITTNSQDSHNSEHLIILNNDEYKTDIKLFDSFIEENGIEQKIDHLSFSSIFIIKNQQLLFNRLVINNDSSEFTHNSELLNLTKKTKYIDSNFSGIIELCGGKQKIIYNKKFRHNINSFYTKYVLLKVNKGQIVKQKKFSCKKYQKFKRKLFDDFFRTEKYNELEASIMNKYGVEDWIAETLIKEKLFYHLNDF